MAFLYRVSYCCCSFEIILSAIAIPSYYSTVRKARQSVAMAFVNQILKAAAVHNIDNGQLPTSWDDLLTGNCPIDSSKLESCSKYNSRCSGNQTNVSQWPIRN